MFTSALSTLKFSATHDIKVRLGEIRALNTLPGQTTSDKDILDQFENLASLTRRNLLSQINGDAARRIIGIKYTQRLSGLPTDTLHLIIRTKNSRTGRLTPTDRIIIGWVQNHHLDRTTMRDNSSSPQNWYRVVTSTAKLYTGKMLRKRK